MKYIKEYYNQNDYKDILNYFFRLYISENFLNISENDFYRIFKKSINEIISDIENNKIKSDKKLFFRIRKELYYLMENNDIIKSEIEKRNYLKTFKSNEYYILNSLNYNFFRLEYYS